MLRANSQISIDEKADNELAGWWWVGRLGEGVSPEGSARLNSPVYPGGQVRRERRDVTRSATVAELMAQYRPSPSTRPFDQMPFATPDDANAVAAACTAFRVMRARVPLFSYDVASKGVMKVRPFTLRPLWTTSVGQVMRAPTPAAYGPAAPVLETCPPPVPAHPPVRAPVESSISSPLLGIVHEIPGGKYDLRALKSCTQSETFGDATP